MKLQCIKRLSNVRCLSTLRIREEFLKHYELNGYKIIKETSLLTPDSETSLLFNNAGMVPLKQYFLNPESINDKLLSSCQPCLRVGGKDNDLEQVGYTNRHLTFFEMLGNFSFGDRNEIQIMKEALDFLINNLNLDLKDLLFTVLEGDEVTFNLWQQLGIPKTQIKYGNKKDNFWSMGKPSNINSLLPCGPCTEIYYDLKNDQKQFDNRYLEIWNLVFMRYSMDFNGNLNNLSTTCIDTGMGLERLASVLQGKDNNFDIDIFQPLIDELEQQIKLGKGIDKSIVNKEDLIKRNKRIIVDHIRSISLLISEGVIPSNVGRGYILRRIIRRCLKYYYQLGLNNNPLSNLTSFINLPISQYNKLYERNEYIKQIINREQQMFSNLLEIGIEKINNYILNNPNNNKILDKEIIFLLYDSYGFPIDLIENIAKENQFNIDKQGFEYLLLKQKQKSKQNNLFKNSTLNDNLPIFNNLNQINQEFIGYHYSPNTIYESTIVDSNEEWIILKENIFYAFGGGQNNDEGIIIDINNNNKEYKIKNIIKLDNNNIVILNLGQHNLKKGQQVISKLDWNYRLGLRRHHSATHLLNYALKKVLNFNVIQAGSKVYNNKLRFDFSYNDKINNIQIQQIEDYINNTLLLLNQNNNSDNGNDDNIQIKSMNYKQAIDQGAVATFSEKYPQIVRTVKLANSLELCSGTHVQDLLEMYPFKINSLITVSSGIKRIEAQCGVDCIQQLIHLNHQVKSILNKYSANDIDSLANKMHTMEKQIKILLKEKQNDIQNRVSNNTNLNQHTINIKYNDGNINIQCFVLLNSNIEYNQSQLIKLIKSLGTKHNDISLLLYKESILLYKVNNNPLNMKDLLMFLLNDNGQGGGSNELAMGKLNIKHNDLWQNFTLNVPKNCIVE